MALSITAGPNPPVGVDFGSFHVDQDDGALTIFNGVQFAPPVLGAATLSSPTVTGDLTFSKAAAEIIPGAASLAIRNTGDTANNLFVAEAGLLAIRDNANANMTTGLTINQLAADDEILALKSSDVGHGLTSVAETDTYAAIRKVAATSGGVQLDVIEDGGSGQEFTLRLNAYQRTAANTTHTGAGRSVVEVYASQHDGANALADIAADGNVFGVRARRGGADVTLLIVDEDGNLFTDDAAATYDDWDDIALVHAFDLRKDFGEWRGANHDTLVAAGIIAPSDAEGNKGMVNWTNLTRLHNGALRQMHARFEALVGAIQSAGTLAELKTHPALA